MMCFIVLNCVLRTMLTVMMALCVVWFSDWLTKLERLGMGVMGGCGLLTVPVIYTTFQGTTSPYDGWASLLFTLGAVLFFMGWMQRKRAHMRNNAMTVKEAIADRARRNAAR